MRLLQNCSFEVLKINRWASGNGNTEKVNLRNCCKLRIPGQLPILKLQLWSTRVCCVRQEMEIQEQRPIPQTEQERRQSKIVATKFRRMQKRWHASYV
jgi:hypothetical protein